MEKMDAWDEEPPNPMAGNHTPKSKVLPEPQHKKEKEIGQDRTVQVSPFSDYEESIITEADDDDDDDDDEAICVCVFLFPCFWHSLIPPRGEVVSSYSRVCCCQSASVEHATSPKWPWIRTGIRISNSPHYGNTNWKQWLRRTCIQPLYNLKEKGLSFNVIDQWMRCTCM